VSYPTGWWSCTIAAKQGKIQFSREAQAKALSFATEYYNADIHVGSKALPQFMQKILGQ
jgi:spermidine synthase